MICFSKLTIEAMTKVKVMRLKYLKIVWRNVYYADSDFIQSSEIQLSVHRLELCLCLGEFIKIIIHTLNTRD